MSAWNESSTSNTWIVVSQESNGIEVIEDAGVDLGVADMEMTGGCVPAQVLGATIVDNTPVLLYCQSIGAKQIGSTPVAECVEKYGHRIIEGEIAVTLGRGSGAVIRLIRCKEAANEAGVRKSSHQGLVKSAAQTGSAEMQSQDAKLCFTMSTIFHQIIDLGKL